MENQTEGKDMGTVELLRLPKDYVLKTENGSYKLLEDVEIRIDEDLEELTEKKKEQNVVRIGKALEEVGFTVLMYDCTSNVGAIELKIIPSRLLEDKPNDSKS